MSLTACKMTSRRFGLALPVNTFRTHILLTQNQRPKYLPLQILTISTNNVLTDEVKTAKVYYLILKWFILLNAYITSTPNRMVNASINVWNSTVYARDKNKAASQREAA